MKRLRWSYKAKLLVNFTALFALFTIILIIFQQHREQEYRVELLETRLRGFADMAATGLENGGMHPDSIAMRRLSVAMPSDVRLTIIDKSGRVLYETGNTPAAAMGNHENRPEVRMAFTDTEGSDIRFSETLGKEFFYYAKAYGGFIVRVALPYDSHVRDFMKADNIFLWFVLLLFPAVVVALLYVSDHFGKTVESLRLFVQAADRGLVDYDHISFPNSELGDIGRSITKKYRQLEESNRRTIMERERLMRHFHYFEEGIAIFAPDRRKLYANPRFLQYVNSLLDRPTADVAAIWEHPTFAPVVEFLNLNRGNRQQAQQGVPIFRFTAPSGGCYYSIQVLIYADSAFELTVSDVTRVEKNKLLKQQMSNNITHELRTPVSSIRGYIETVLDCKGLSEERRRYFIEKAHNQVVRLTDLIRDVALITKVEEAPETMQRETLDVRRIVDDIAEELRPQMEERSMTFDCAIRPDVRLQGNYSLVYSIFRNLMENSIRYAGEGTAMHAECYNCDTEFCYFTFYDTGCGVDEQHLARLFERFYRVTEGRTRDCGGTGLGLSIVRNAVLFHRGDISVRNRKEGGLEFLFTLHR